MLVKGRITIAVQEEKQQVAERNDQEFKSYIKKLCPFTDCMSEINNKQIDNANGLDVLVPMYNLIQYSNKYSKILRGL